MRQGSKVETPPLLLGRKPVGQRKLLVSGAPRRFCPGASSGIAPCQVGMYACEI